MSTFIDYTILPKEKLIIEYFSGSVCLEDVITFKEKLILDKHYHSGFNIIDDLRDAQFELNKTEVKGYVNYILHNRKNLGNRNTAFITTTPNQVVISTLFETLKENIPINTLVASTLETALNHVQISTASASLVKDCINKLEEKSKHNQIDKEALSISAK